MADDEKDNADVYQISGLSKPPETVFAPSDTSDIFAIKKENTDRLGSIIGLALSEGVFLCNAYRLDKRISRDEMGEIWQAADLQASRNVTLYLPPTEIRKAESTIEPIRQAARRVEALDHPRIVPILDNFTDPEHGLFIVRKLVNGKTLDLHWQEHIKQHKKTALFKTASLKVVKMLNDIAHALDYAHGVDIVHGDLCPKNITISLEDEVYVDNFALLPVQADIAPVTRKPYLPPEVVDGNAAVAASDTYALAVIAYELLSGQLPFSPEQNMPLPIPGVPSTVDAVIRKALSKDPDDRYDSCSDFVKALEAGFQEPPKIKPAAVVARPKPLKKKTATRVSLLAVSLLMGLFIGGAVACFVYDVRNVRTELLAMLAEEKKRTSTGTDAGANAGTNAGADTGTNAGANTRTDTGTDTGTNAGANTRTDIGTNAGADTGTNAETGE